MPTININKNAFEKLVGKKLPLEQLKDRISYLGTDLEKIEGDEIVVEVFPDRPDMLSVQGLARALSSFVGVNTGLKKYNVKKSNDKVIVEDSVKKYRPYTACAIVKNMHFDDEKIKEVIQIQEKLHITYGRNRKKAAIGIYPFEKIKTPIRFLAEDPKKIMFVPLESNKEMSGLQILSQHPAGRDYGHLLEGLDKFPFFIDANNEILSMPPIINSHKIGKITEKTKDAFIECSGFDFDILKKCLNMIVCALADIGGEIYSMELVYGSKKITSPDLKAEKMKLDLKYVNKILGLNLKENEIKKYLERMGYDYSNGTALIPAYRADVMHPIDLVEDVAIAYGYETFKDEIPNVSTIGEEDSLEIFKRKISNIMIGFGLLETSTYHLTNKKDLVENMERETDFIDIEKASSSDYNILRTWMMPSMMQVLRLNKHNEYPQRLFEIGTVFIKNNKTETGADEPAKLAVVSCHKDAGFTEVKQFTDYLFLVLGLKYEIREFEHTSFIPGRVGKIIIHGKEVGLLGEIHLKVLENFGLEMPVAAMEVNVSELFETIKLHNL